MNPMISTILDWERRLELGHHQAHLARRDRFENRTSPTPGSRRDSDLGRDLDAAAPAGEHILDLLTLRVGSQHEQVVSGLDDRAAPRRD